MFMSGSNGGCKQIVILMDYSFLYVRSLKCDRSNDEARCEGWRGLMEEERNKEIKREEGEMNVNIANYCFQLLKCEYYMCFIS